jgi:hypothetical protein
MPVKNTTNTATPAMRDKTQTGKTTNAAQTGGKDSGRQQPTLLV